MKSIVNKGMAKVKPPKKKLAMLDTHPYVVEFEKDYAAVEIFSHSGSVAIALYADFKTNKFKKSELADLQAFHKAVGDVITYVEKQL